MEAYDNMYIMVFASHSQATYLYNELKNKGFRVEFISTPSRIASGCSKSIIFKFEDLETAVPAAQKINAKINGIYKMIWNKKDYDYIKI